MGSIWHRMQILAVVVLINFKNATAFLKTMMCFKEVLHLGHLSRQHHLSVPKQVLRMYCLMTTAPQGKGIRSFG